MRLALGDSASSTLQATCADRIIGGRAALLVRLALRPAVRLAAARVLAEAGTVDDAALLSDLVSVLRTTDEGHEERRALLDAMWTIAHRD